MIHFELENYEFLNYIIKSTNRFINKTERDYNIENYLIKQLKRLAKAVSLAEKNDVFNEMKSDIEVMFKTPQERVVLEYFDLPAWVDSHVLKTTMAEAIKRR
jgi:hypothetical protein